MRRSDREITEHGEIMEIIGQCDVCRLAFNDSVEGVPYILPLNFGYEEDCGGQVTLYFHGATEGYKYDVLARDCRVAFEMDCGHHLASDRSRGYCTMEYSSVIGRGRIEIVADRDEKIRALTILTDNYHRAEGHFEFNQQAVDRTTVMALKVEAMTAKRRVVKPR